MFACIVAESDPVRRLKAAARRSAGQVAVETQREWYLEELEQTLGRDPGGSARWQAAHAAEGRSWVGLVILLLFVAVVTFAATAALLMWQDGRLGRFFEVQGFVPDKRPVHWVLGDQETGRAAPVPTGKEPKGDAPPNEIEPLLHPAPAVRPATEAEPPATTAEDNE